jgi:hypothetical protein
MICVRVPLLLKRNVGVLFGVLRGTRMLTLPSCYFYLQRSCCVPCAFIKKGGVDLMLN